MTQDEQKALEAAWLKHHRHVKAHPVPPDDFDISFWVKDGFFSGWQDHAAMTEGINLDAPCACGLTLVECSYPSCHSGRGVVETELWRRIVRMRMDSEFDGVATVTSEDYFRITGRDVYDDRAALQQEGPDER
jgi:hypothetical protein